MCGGCGGCLTRCNKGQVHATVARQPSPDGMRNGQFNYEVSGDDYASCNVKHDRPDLAYMGTRTNPDMNQAESGIPLRSPAGAALHRNAAMLVRQMNPLIYLARFNGNIGITLARNTTQNNVLIPDTRYDGILPLTMQPKIDKPQPY